MKNKSKHYLVVGMLLVAVIGGLAYFSNRTKDRARQQDRSPQNTLYPVDAITHGHGLAVDAQDSSKIYIATHHGLLVLVNDKELYTVGQSKDDYMGFSPNSKNAKVFFSSGHPEAGGNIGFQKSEDGGFTWKKISDGLDGPVDFHAMAVSPVNPNLVYGWYQGNLQKSTDGGKSWQKFPTNFVVVRLIADTDDENIVYAASPQGLFMSSNKGESWQRILEGFIATLAIHPKESQTMLVSSENLGLAKTIDKGKT